MRYGKDIIEKLMVLETQNGSYHHFYFTGKSLPALEKHGFELIDNLQRDSPKAFKGIVKHFSIIMPYFDDTQGAESFLHNLKESVSIAKDCYDIFSGYILIECDKEWSVRGTNHTIAQVLEYIKSLDQVRFFILLPSDNDKGSEEFYNALTTVGIWAFIKIEEIDFQLYIEKWKSEICDAGFSIESQVLGELCLMLEKRQDGIGDVDDIFSQWLRQLRLNRMIADCDDRKISIDDVSLLSGITTIKNNHTIGFGTGR